MTGPAMTPERIRRWKLTIKRLDSLANSDPILRFPEIADTVIDARDRLFDEFGRVLANDVMRGKPGAERQEDM